MFTWAFLSSKLYLLLLKFRTILKLSWGWIPALEMCLSFQNNCLSFLPLKRFHFRTYMYKAGLCKYSALTENMTNTKSLQRYNKNVLLRVSGCQLNSLGKYWDISHASSRCELDLKMFVLMGVSGCTVESKILLECMLSGVILALVNQLVCSLWEEPSLLFKHHLVEQFFVWGWGLVDFSLSSLTYWLVSSLFTSSYIHR